MKKINNKQIWQAVLGELEVSLSKANLTTWFKNTHLISNDKGFTVLVPNGFTKEWLKNKYHKDILRALKKAVGKVGGLNYAIRSEKRVKEKVFVAPKTDLKQADFVKNGYLNPRYTFESFVVGNGNKLVYATCQAVVKKPGEAYNPLFIYGGVGLGKTHLMQAIGNAMVKKIKNKKVVYVTCEKFVNEFVQGISTGRINRFKNNK